MPAAASEAPHNTSCWLLAAALSFQMSSHRACLLWVLKLPVLSFSPARGSPTAWRLQGSGCMSAPPGGFSVPPAHLSRVHVLCRFSFIQLFAAPCTAARQAPLSMGFSRQEYWGGLPCPPPGHLPNSGIEPVSLKSPALEGRFFTTSAPWEALLSHTAPFISVKITAYDDLFRLCFSQRTVRATWLGVASVLFPQSAPNAHEVPAVGAPCTDPGIEEG